MFWCELDEDRCCEVSREGALRLRPRRQISRSRMIRTKIRRPAMAHIHQRRYQGSSVDSEDKSAIVELPGIESPNDFPEASLDVSDLLGLVGAGVGSAVITTGLVAVSSTVFGAE